MDNIDNIESPEVGKFDKRCAPGVSFDAGSCINLRLLVEMANAYNTENKNSPIILYPNYETTKPKKYKKYLLKQFQKSFSKSCSTQKCWTEQQFMKKMKQMARDELQKYTFRPDGPQGKFEWLNTLNINDVMQQYEKEYSDFKFLGAVPMDFDDLPSLGVVNFDFNKSMQDKKTKLGIIFNLDESWKDGSHWVAMYADMTKGEVYYFDSYGTIPEPRVRKLMRRFIKFYQVGLGKEKYIADYNKIRHQYENSECGVYSMNFILRMLKGENFKDVCESKTPDKKINKCRNVYFGNANI